ncbi:MAG TPA: transcriptional repressor [Anaerolineaceae bacterium]|jgi:Fur family ferric uptake transcriptional regulator|nr:transcriptional repressor [Anaerolineaceae bacterium]
MRSSSAQKIILDVMKQAGGHLSAFEIYEATRDRLPAVNPSTVYRILHRLVQLGQTSISDMGTGAAVYELIGPRHHHLVCETCGRVVNLDDEDVTLFFEQLGQKYRINIDTQHLVLFGSCPDCHRPETAPHSVPHSAPRTNPQIKP